MVSIELRYYIYIYIYIYIYGFNNYLFSVLTINFHPFDYGCNAAALALWEHRKDHMEGWWCTGNLPIIHFVTWKQIVLKSTAPVVSQMLISREYKIWNCSHSWCRANGYHRGFFVLGSPPKRQALWPQLRLSRYGWQGAHATAAVQIASNSAASLRTQADPSPQGTSRMMRCQAGGHHLRTMHTENYWI